MECWWLVCLLIAAVVQLIIMDDCRNTGLIMSLILSSLSCDSQYLHRKQRKEKGNASDCIVWLKAERQLTLLRTCQVLEIGAACIRISTVCLRRLISIRDNRHSHRHSILLKYSKLIVKLNNFNELIERGIDNRKGMANSRLSRAMSVRSNAVSDPPRHHFTAP